MFDGAGPDLLGVAEVENEATLQQLVDAVTVRNDLRIATFVDGPDIRGIDCALVYADTVFETIDDNGVGPASHNVNNRYPTRDIFEMPLRLLANDAELIVMVNHWPPRRLGRFESEPLRIALVNHCGRLVDNHLKYTRRELFELGDTAATMELLQQRWNRHILVMGDFNDEPSDRSIDDELLAGRDLDRIEEPLEPGAQRKTPTIPTYAAKEAPLFNCMSPLTAVPDRRTPYYASSASTFNVLDQFIVSRGLYYGLAGLRMTRAVTGYRTQLPTRRPTPRSRLRPSPPTRLILRSCGPPRPRDGQRISSSNSPTASPLTTRATPTTSPSSPQSTPSMTRHAGGAARSEAPDQRRRLAPVPGRPRSPLTRWVREDIRDDSLTQRGRLNPEHRHFVASHTRTDHQTTPAATALLRRAPTRLLRLYAVMREPGPAPPDYPPMLRSEVQHET